MFEIHSTANLQSVAITYTFCDGTENTSVCQFAEGTTDVAIAAYAQAWLDNANAQIKLEQANEIVAPE